MFEKHKVEENGDKWCDYHKVVTSYNMEIVIHALIFHSKLEISLSSIVELSIMLFLDSCSSEFVIG